MKLLLLQKFNNYFNRTISLYSTTADYISHASSSKVYTDVNFNPNDGIHTKHIIGKGRDENFNINECDYLVCYDTYDQTESIVSRWYIIEAVRTRANQYELTLKRDTIADNFNTLLSCPAYIKKGTVDDSNPLIVNNEGVRVNQIKQSETLLKDATGSSWIVGYMAKNAPATAISVQIPDEANVSYETIEGIADEFGVSTADLDAALTEAKNNPSYFVNDNIEIYATIDYPGLNNEDRRVGGGSQNFLSTFTYGSYARVIGNTTNDVLAFENWSGVEAQSNVRSALKNYWISALSYYAATIKSQWKSNVGKPFFTRSLFNRLSQMAENDVFIYKQGRYYRIRIGDNSVKNTNYEVNKVGSVFANVVEKYKTDYNTWAANTHYDPSTYIIAYVRLIDQTAGKVRVNYNELTANLYLEEVTDFSDIPGISISMSTTRNAILDQPYDMFAIPASNTQIVLGANTYDVKGAYAQKTAMALVKELNSANVYDVQLLPYCPIPELASNGRINISSLTASKDYDFIYKTGDTVRTSTDVAGQGSEYAPGQYEAEFFVSTGVAQADFYDYGFEVIENDTGYTIYPVKTTQVVGGKVNIIVSCQINNFQDADHITVRIWYDHKSDVPVVKSIIIYPKSNSFSTNLNYNLQLKDSMKVDSNCDMYRLVSPNYQGTFEFNVANNGGSVNGFIAECTYKPYTPYIKVAPNFSWLYGTNFGDARGLICGGDFSIGIINEKWQEYQLQNKNYQNIFNREIQNLDINQEIAKFQQRQTSYLGVIQAGVAGEAGGAIMSGGNPYAAAAVGISTAAVSAEGAIYDTINFDRQQKEARQFSIDKFKMQLGNIQALPYTLTKVGAFDINSKIWPFLEYYTCTEQEKEAFKMKIQYEGMTVGIVGLLGDYMIPGSYLQADLIRNQSIIEDSHTVDDIYVELTKGVYL